MHRRGRRSGRRAAAGSGATGASPRVRPLPASLILFLSLIGALPARAQAFGQWWWEASARLGQQNTSRRVDGTKSRLDYTNLTINVGLNGYLGHPALGNFRLGFDLGSSENEAGRKTESDVVGYRADVTLLPRGAYPSSLFVERKNFDYTVPDEQDALSTLRVADTFTRWGGRFRAKRGPLKGLFLGVDRGVSEYVDANDEEVLCSRYLEWSRVGRRLQHRVRAEYRRRDLDLFPVEFSQESLVTHVEEKGDLTPKLRWQMFWTGVQRNFTSAASSATEADSYSLTNRLFQSVRDRDHIDVEIGLGTTRRSSRPSRDTYDVSVTYRWRPTDSSTIAPFGRYGLQTTNGRRLEAPAAGVGASWNRDAGALRTLVSGRAGWTGAKLTDSRRLKDDTRTSLSLAGSLAHGDPGELQKEFEMEWSRNELRFSRNPILEFPDLSLDLNGVGVSRLLRGRFSLLHRWNSSSVGGWGEWSRRESDGGLSDADLDLETATATFQYGGPAYGLQANYGTTRVRQGDSGEERARFAGASAMWRPFRGVTLRASYRQTTREILLLPDIESSRVEAGVSARLGLLDFDASAFASGARVFDSAGRTTRGFTWSVGRRFAGWLPIATGVQRRGVIR